MKKSDLKQNDEQNSSHDSKGINKKEIEKLAELSKIDLEESEKDKLSKKIGDILGYVSEINDISVEGAENHLSEHRNITRADENPNTTGEFTEKILEEAPRTKDGFIKVKKVL